MTTLILLGLLFLQQQGGAGGSGIIAGRVLFADGQPAEGIAMTAVPLDGGVSRTARVNPSGEYRLQNLPPGRYYVRTAPPDSGTFYPGTAVEAEAVAIPVTDASVTENVNFSLTPAASGVRVSGRVLFPEGQRSTGRLLMSGGSPFQFRGATIGADGSFELLHIRPGAYSITLDVPGLDPVRLTVTDSSVSDIELRVPRLAAVQGRATIERSGLPPEMKLIFEGPPNRVETAVQPDGSFTALLPTGIYAIRLEGLGTNRYLSSLTTGATDLLKEPLRITSPDTTPQMAVAIGISSGVKVSGRLSLSGNIEEIIPSSIVLANPVTNQAAEGRINEDGSFELRGVMPGAYSAIVSSKGSSLPSARISLVVPPKDVTDLQIVVPGLKEIEGRITVEGSGPAPRFSFVVIRGGEGLLAASADATQLPVLSTPPAMLRATNVPNGLQVLRVNVNALADGTFKIKLPLGEYRIAQDQAPPGGPANAFSGSASPYFLRSMSYGTARLTTEPLRVTETDSPELQIGFGTTIPNPWVKVSGRVTGVDSARGPFRVALEGSITSTIEAPVDPDGSFQFNSVLRGTTYTARLIPTHDAAPAPRVTVVDKDITSVELTVPAEKEVILRTTVADNGPLPGFILSLAGGANTMSALVRPDRDGTFKIKLPMDERRITLRGLPLGYEVKTLTYGSTDLLKLPLRVLETDSAELHVGLATNPSIPFGTVKGRVTGLDPELRSARLVLNGAAAFSTFEAPVNPDGSFSFSKIPQGMYTPSIADGLISGRLTPTSIVVTGIEAPDIEIQAPSQNTGTLRAPVVEPASGATVIDMAGGNRESANESAAVATLRTINTALITYLNVSGGRYGNLQDLIGAGLLDSSLAGPKAGFSFSIISIGAEYAAAAIPTSADAGRYGFYSMADAVVRYSTVDFLAPANRSGNAVQ
jgi:hypothetical protein